MRGRERRDRLARMAEQAIGSAPPRAPFYVGPADVGDAPWMQAPGWYWQAPGAHFPTYLGHNSTRAEMALLELRARRRATA
jgi:hypothetical protein